MSRYFRLWEKKRGDRRTGSKLVGRVGEALFWGVLFLLGAAGLTILFSLPESAVGNAALSGWALWLAGLVAAALALAGGVGVTLTVSHTVASVERRAALARKAADLDLLRDALPSSTDYPYIPRDNHLTNSPGTLLRYRLPVIRSPISKLLAITAFCLAWNGLAAALVVWAIESYLQGKPEWPLTLFLIPYVAVGVWAIYYFVRQLHLQAGVGPTMVEISELPLRPGGKFEVALTQIGALSVESLAMTLVCEEEATFRQGTDVRVETCRVLEQPVFRQEKFQIELDVPFVRREPFVTPPQAMHSFQAPNNAIRWKLVVNGKVEGWPDFERSFPVLVYPSEQREAKA